MTVVGSQIGPHSQGNLLMYAHGTKSLGPEARVLVLQVSNDFRGDCPFRAMSTSMHINYALCLICANFKPKQGSRELHMFSSGVGHFAEMRTSALYTALMQNT